MNAPVRTVVRGVLTQAVSRVYSIGIYAGTSPLSLAPSPAAVNPVLAPENVSDTVATGVADPFMIRVDGTWHMFLEVVSWRGRSRKGEIAVATSRDGLRWAYRGVVLSEPFHLSYPYVFRHGSDHYMVPESNQAGAVRLYRADRFPDRWSLAGTLLTGRVLVDSSLFERDGRWWMLTETNPEHRHDTLRLFHAQDLLGPWREHPSSPVVAGDATGARPAGRVLSLPDRVIRFAQVCQPSYGTSVRAFEITELTARRYREAPLPRPLLEGTGTGWNRSGMHHVDAHRLEDGRWMACVDGWSGARGPRRLLDWARQR